MTTYVFVGGQPDNLGDSVLRRPVIRCAQARTAPCHIFLRRLPADYVANLGLREPDRTYTSRAKWLAAMLRSRPGSTVFMDAGEVTWNRPFALGLLQALPLIGFARRSRGRVFQTGVGVRVPSDPVPVPARMLLRWATVVGWRDQRSQQSAGTGEVYPDWAFREGAGLAEIERRHAQAQPVAVGISLRGDGPGLDAAWLTQFRDTVREHQVHPIVVVQARRDNERASQLAAELHAELVDWPSDRDHAEQEALVRTTYARCSWVVTDRLHAAVVAATEGAVPLNVLPNDRDKIPRTLAGAGLHYDAEQLTALDPMQLADRRQRLRNELSAARARLAELEGLLAGGRDSPGRRVTRP